MNVSSIKIKRRFLILGKSQTYLPVSEPGEQTSLCYRRRSSDVSAARVPSSLFLILLLLFNSADVGAERSAQTVLFATGFEVSEGYDRNSTLSGQNGWTDSGFTGQGLVTNVFEGAGQQAYIGFNVPTNRHENFEVQKQIPYEPLQGDQPVVTFSVRMAIYASTNTNHDDFRWSVVNSEGNRLLTLDFDTETHTVNYTLDDGVFRSTSITYLDATLYDLVVTINFARNLWSATLNSTPLVLTQAITSTNSTLNLGRIAARWVPHNADSPGDNFMVFDDYRIVAEPNPTAPSTLVFSTSFESSEAYLLQRTLAGQNGWRGTGSGGNGLVTNFFTGDVQQAYIGFGPPTNQDASLVVLRRLNFHPLATHLPTVTFSVRMAIYSSTTTNQDHFFWSMANTEGTPLIVLGFNNLDHTVIHTFNGSSGPRQSSTIFTNSTAYVLTISMDFARNLWNATLDSTPLATDQPITTANSALTLGTIAVQWIVRNPDAPGDNFMVFDNFRITAEPAPKAQPSLQFRFRSPGGQVFLRLAGAADQKYALETSTDLIRWAAINTLSSSGGISDFVDADASSLSLRFYRAREVP